MRPWRHCETGQRDPGLRVFTNEMNQDLAYRQRLPDRLEARFEALSIIELLSDARPVCLRRDVKQCEALTTRPDAPVVHRFESHVVFEPATNGEHTNPGRLAGRGSDLYESDGGAVTG